MYKQKRNNSLKIICFSEGLFILSPYIHPYNHLIINSYHVYWVFCHILGTVLGVWGTKMSMIKSLLLEET